MQGVCNTTLHTYLEGRRDVFPTGQSSLILKTITVVCVFVCVRVCVCVFVHFFSFSVLGVCMVFQGSLKGIGSLKKVPRMFQRSFKGVYRKF